MRIETAAALPSAQFANAQQDPHRPISSNQSRIGKSSLADKSLPENQSE